MRFYLSYLACTCRLLGFHFYIKVYQGTSLDTLPNSMKEVFHRFHIQSFFSVLKFIRVKLKTIKKLKVESLFGFDIDITAGLADDSFYRQL